ncbi:hypothetical protein EIJ82_01690 [Alkalihalobacillus clausii]|nr:hypothetical protein [Shouchella clausii]
MEITLRIDGKDKTFVNSFVPFVMKRKALELEKYTTQKNADPIKYFDMQAAYVVELFGNQFTKEEFENGLDVSKAQDVLYEIVGVGVIGYPSKEEQEKRLGEILANQKEAQENKQK